MEHRVKKNKNAIFAQSLDFEDFPVFMLTPILMVFNLICILTIMI